MALFLFVSLAPSLFLLAYIYLRDVYEPEPRVLVAKVFLSGALLMFVAAAIGQAIAPFFRGDLVLESFIVAGFTEELVKFLGCLVIFYRNPQFDEEMDGIVYASALAMGFASAENILYVLVQGVPSGVLRALLPVPGHALFSVFMGYYLGRARFATSTARTTFMVRSLFTPALLHGVFNYFMSSDPGIAALAAPLMAYLWWSSLKRIKLAEADSQYKRKATLPQM